MTEKNKTAGGATGGWAETRPDEQQGHPNYTTPAPALSSTPADPLATYHLARYVAGATDADLDMIRRTFPDAPLDSRDNLQAWLETQPDLLHAVLATDPAAPPTPSKKTAWTTQELLLTKFPELRWVVPGILPEGLTLLAGRPKIGKSWFALQLAYAVGTGGQAFDRQVNSGKVLYLALEDSPRRIQRRIKSQGWPATADVVFHTEWPDIAQEGGLAKLHDTIVTGGYTFVVVDTLSRAARFDQSDIGESTAVLGNMQRLAADHRCAILVIDHYRKPAGFVHDMIDDVLGSTGKVATADAILGLVRERGKRGATLCVTGRDLEENNWAIEWDATTCCWHLLGDAQEVALTEAGQDVLRALSDLGGEATTKEIAEHLDRGKGTVSKALSMLISEGKVHRGEKKGREVPYRLIKVADIDK